MPHLLFFKVARPSLGQKGFFVEKACVSNSNSTGMFEKRKDAIRSLHVVGESICMSKEPRYTGKYVAQDIPWQYVEVKAFANLTNKCVLTCSRALYFALHYHIHCSLKRQGGNLDFVEWILNLRFLSARNSFRIWMFVGDSDWSIENSWRLTRFLFYCNFGHVTVRPLCMVEEYMKNKALKRGR